MSNSACILWLEHVDPELLSVVPSIQHMVANGIDLQLTPQPIIDRRGCYYQTLTGMGAGKTGYFDAVKPLAYRAHLEEDVPDGILGRLLPDILRARGLAATMVEAQNREELDAAAQQGGDCAIVRLSAKNDADIVEDLVRRCTKKHQSPGAHLLVLTEVWHAPVKRYVNINNFLADSGLLEVGTPRSPGSIIWSETLAYYLGNGQIWINLRGREPQGCVAPGREYQQVCEALQQELSAWRDPDTSEPIIARALKKEDVYTGEYLFKAPDLIVEFLPGYAPSQQAVMLDFDTAAVYSAGNGQGGKPGDPHARLIASGPSLVNGYRGSARLVDVVPNVIYLLEKPVPGHVDGRVIPHLFTQSHRQQHPRERIDDDFALTSEEEGHIEERLRALGYIG